MARKLNVIVSQGQSNHPAKRQLEEQIVTGLMLEPGIDVAVVPHLYDLAPDGSGILCLQGVTGDMVVVSWLYSCAAHWVLDRNGVRGAVGEVLLQSEDEDEPDESADTSDEEPKERVVDQRESPNRKIYCLDLRVEDSSQPFLDEIRRIAEEVSTQTVDLMQWIGGSPNTAQLDRYLDPEKQGVPAPSSGNGNAGRESTPPAESSPSPETSTVLGQPLRIDELPARRWYPVIDFSRCTNCLECIDFCLFGVYGIDRVDTILVEQPDNCRKGCPACSRVCPENAIIFPQHKSPSIAGSPEVVGTLKIDLSQLFGAPQDDGLETAVAERDEQLLIVGRDAVGMSVGIPKRQSGLDSEPKDELDDLIDGVDV